MQSIYLLHKFGQPIVERQLGATKSIKAIASLWLYQFTLNDWNCSEILLSPLRLTRVWKLHGIEWLRGRARSWNLWSILSSDIFKSKSFQILVVMFFFIFLLRWMVWLGIDAPKWSGLNSDLNCCTFVPRYSLPNAKHWRIAIKEDWRGRCMSTTRRL